MNGTDSFSKFDIRNRAFSFALDAIQLFQLLCEGRNNSGMILGKQFLRAATSIDACIEEAQSAESKADFIHKFSIAQKEARESLYWLRLLEHAAIGPQVDISKLLREANEIVSIVTSIIVNTKNNKNRGIHDR